jgi:predicted alpha-1,2-mannosidase
VRCKGEDIIRLLLNPMNNFQMKRSILSFIAFTNLIFLCAQNSVYVNPFIGTKSMGHVFPGAVAPHGIIALSPDTDTIPHNVDGKYQPDVYRYCAGYQYDDRTIVGFSHTHFSGTGHSDLGDLLLMPTCGKLLLTPGTKENPDAGYRSRFSHEKETAMPGFYSVTLEDYNIEVELTATERVGVHRYHYPDENARVIFDLVHGIYNYDGKTVWASVRVESPQLITGYRITNGWARENYQYFAISFSQPIVNYGYEEYEKPKYGGGWRKFNLKENFPEIAGRKIRCFFEFQIPNRHILEARLAFSAVSTEGALKNLETEAPFSKSFDDIWNETQQKWEKELNFIEAKGNNDQLAMLYTSLYHCKINPSVYQDVDGKYRGLEGNTHEAEDFTNYTIFSLWDTYRALHPLMNLMDRKRSEDFVKSMLAHRAQSVHKILPMWSHFANENWCMIGYHGVSVLADAIAKNIPINIQEALEAMYASSTLSYFDKTAEYMQFGYVPYDVSKNGVSITLEYAYDDWCIYQTALKAGDIEKAEEYKNRALNYKNVFDPNLRFARAKYSNGSWKNDFSLLNTYDEGFIEGNSWNYSFYVPHDVLGLMQLMGGDKAFINNLDTLLSMHLPDDFFAETEDVTREGLLGGYVHGNEPSHHIIYMYNFTSQPWKAQYWIREVMNKMYRNDLDGLCGNDDCGQMSAWYIFSSMGFYPLCPGANQLVLAAPYLPYLKLNLPEDKTFEIKAPKVSDKNRYVQSVKLNGKPYTKAYITNDDVMNGGMLEFEMTHKPNIKRVFKGEELPYSMTEK